LKILFYSSKSTYSGKSFGGAERSMAVMAEVHLGHNVHFLSGRDNVRFAKAKRIEENGVQLHFLPVFKFFFLRFKPFRKFSEYIRRLILQNCLNEFHDFEILYAYNEYPGLYQIVQWRESSQSRIKIVYRVAGLYLFDTVLKVNPNLKVKAAELLTEVDMVNFNSLGMRDLFLEKMHANFDHLNIKEQLLLDVGVKTSFSNKQWMGPKKSQFTIVMVANFGTYAKRQDLLIESFKLWGQKDAHLMFLGDGPRLSELKKYCQYDVFLSGHTDFRGFIDSPQIIHELRNSSVFCLCTESEGLSKSIAEAMSLGVPLLVSNVSAINTYITNNENGVLVDNTVEAWVSALDKMYNTSKEELKALSKREIAYAKEHFDVEVNAKKYIVAFESLVQS
jgi:glycosyltransferase involved in cell wall biosynthesis